MDREVTGTITIGFTTFVDGEDFDRATAKVARIKEVLEEELEGICDLINRKVDVEVDVFDVEMEM